MKQRACSRAAVAVAITTTLLARRASAQQTAPSAAPPGCESVTLALPRVTDAHGAPIARYAVPAPDHVADEGAAFLHAFASGAPDAVASREAAVRAWARLNASEPIAQYVLGRLASELNHPPDAITAYTAALRLAPGFADAEYNLGDVLARGGRIDEAVVHFDRAAAIDPQSVDALYNAGMALYTHATFDRALAHWCAARRVAPDDFGAAKKVVQALNALGRFADADRARTAADQLHARSADPQVRALRSYVIDQRHRGGEDVMVEEVFPTSDPTLQYYYRFACARGATPVRVVTLEGSGVIREHGIAAIVGIEQPNGAHSTTSITFSTMPTYAALRPVAEALIGRLQHGDNSAIGATSTTH